MKKIWIFIFFIFIFIFLFLSPTRSLGFQGTDIWSTGDGIEYLVNIYSGTDALAFYDLVDDPYWIEYQGLENGSMQFLNYVDQEFIAEWFFGGSYGAIYNVDPETGFDSEGNQLFMFFDTTDWVVGKNLGFNFTQTLPDNHIINSEYKVLNGIQTLTAAGREIEYWTIGFDDIDYVNGTSKYVFRDYYVQVTENGGIMIGKNQNYILYTDKNEDNQFTEDEKGFHIDISFRLNNISDNLESNFLPTSESNSSSDGNSRSSGFIVTTSIFAILPILIIKKRR